MFTGSPKATPKTWTATFRSKFERQVKVGLFARVENAHFIRSADFEVGCTQYPVWAGHA